MKLIFTSYWAPIALVAGVLFNMSAYSAPLTISNYDVKATPEPGFGCWSHAYNGTILDTGRTVAGSASCPPAIIRILDYTDGSGTLNDTIIGNSTSSTHLFVNRRLDASGSAILPEITLHLEGASTINEIVLFGGNIPFNGIPGAITGVTVGINGVEVVLNTIPSGDPNPLGVKVNDRVVLTGTPLEGVQTTEVTLKNFVASFFGFPFDQFSIAEIQVDGELAPVVLPIGIDIKPENQVNKIELTDDNRIKVAILSSNTFDAPASVERTSLTFGKTGSEPSLDSCNARPSDVNRDGFPDLICVFSIPQMGFVTGDTRGVLKGKTVDETLIHGEDSVLTTDF